MVWSRPIEDVRPVLVVSGPTASGKSALALRLAQSLGGEIISADSVQVYRGFDIGSAKPSKAEQSLVRHHLIDCCGAHEQYNAARFRADSLEIIGSLNATGRQAVVVGGTTLYLSALLSGLSEFPEIDPVLRAELQSRPVAELYAELQIRDSVRAAELHPNDKLRIVRALEIAHQTGLPPSEQRVGTGASIDHPTLVINLCVDPEILSERIATRSMEMVRQGLVEETRALLEINGSTAAPFATVGYAQAVALLKGELLPEQLVEEITIATRQLAKRQRTFWRNEPPKRGWTIGPDSGDQNSTVLLDDRAVSRRGKGIQKGFSAYALSYGKLLEKIEQRVSAPVAGIEVWHVLLTDDQ